MEMVLTRIIVVNSGVRSSTYCVSKCTRDKTLGGVKTVKGLDKVQKASILIVFADVKSEIFTYIIIRVRLIKADEREEVGVCPSVQQHHFIGLM
jgi:hypothetical protein